VKTTNKYEFQCAAKGKSMEYFLELWLGGLSRGSIYALIALGYTMVYGIIQLINFAHGEIYMIGAFTALIVANVFSILGWNEIGIMVAASAAAIVYFSTYGFTTVEKIAYQPPGQEHTWG
jgi:branched-chain amino acid transport system permease protein